MLAAGLLGSFVVFTQVDKLPLSVQRSLSLLPIRIDALAQQSADASSNWRVQMWKVVLPEVPKYLFLGKGYAMDPNDLFLADNTAARNFVDSGAGAAFSGDYHNGPLSVLIPFGIYGAVAFCWFLTVGARVLYRNFKHGNPALHSVNALLLSAFVGRIIFFFFVFGAIGSDMVIFAGLLGLGVALNGGEASSSAEQKAPGIQYEPHFNKPYPRGLASHV
jgi:hypothetical protein